MLPEIQAGNLCHFTSSISKQLYLVLPDILAHNLMSVNFLVFQGFSHVFQAAEIGSNYW